MYQLATPLISNWLSNPEKMPKIKGSEEESKNIYLIHKLENKDVKRR